MADEPLNFGIIGCGAIAPTHAGAIRRLGHRLVAVADPIPARAMKLAEGTDARVYATHADLVNDPAVQAVCVCTPSGMHVDHAVVALDAGKHALVEKPMDVTVAACRRLVAAAERTGLTVAVVSQHRFDAASLLAKRMIDAGDIGRIVLATADVKWWRTQDYYDEGDWRGTWQFDGGGALMNQGIHTVDVLQWLCGGVDAVSAQTRTAAHERIEVEDVAVLSLRFRGGAIGSLIATTAAFDGQPVRIEIHGTGGSILLEGDNIRRISLRDGRTFESQDAAEHAVRVARGGTASVSAPGGEPTRPTAPAGAAWGDAHRAQIEDFVQALRSGLRPMIDAAGGLEPVAVACGAYRSAREGGIWIPIDP